MKLDALNRQLPWIPPDEHDKPACERFDFTPGDYAIFNAINRHGPLPSHYLLELQKPHRKAKTHTLERLKDLCFGSLQDGKILYAPEDQFAQPFAHARHKVYDLTLAGQALIERGVPPSHSNWWVHDFMQACVGASFELTAPLHGFRYVPRSEVLSSEKLREARDSKNPLAVPVSNKVMRIDDLFALENEEGKKRYFAVHIDRSSESMKPSGTGHVKWEALDQGITYFGRTLEQQLQILRDDTVRRWWGFNPKFLHVLIPTTTASRANRILRYLADQPDQSHIDRFKVFVLPGFGKKWRVPETVLTDLMAKEWYTVDGPRLITA